MATQTWNIDPVHSSVHFSVRYLMLAKVRGSFTKFSGTLQVDEADFTKSALDVKIDMASITTADEKRDAHLKSPEFFDVAKFPEMTFKGRQLQGTPERFKVVGDLTLHGVTKPVELEVVGHGGGKDPTGNERRGFSATTTINRPDFDVVWNQTLEAGGALVSEKVEIDLEISVVKAK